MVPSYCSRTQSEFIHCACNVTGCDCYRRYDNCEANNTSYFVTNWFIEEIDWKTLTKFLSKIWREFKVAAQIKLTRTVPKREKLDIGGLAPPDWRPALPRGLGIVPKATRI